MTDDRLLSVLEQSKSRGFLGPGPVEDHIDHAHRFTRALNAFVIANREWMSSGGRTRRPLRLADLGAGGGVPALPLLVDRERDRGSDRDAHLESTLAGASAVLIDASRKRCSFLVWACAELGLRDRVEVWCGRAEELAHHDRARFAFDLVVARSFGPPAWTVECGAPLLNPDGLLCISEPPQRRPWPADGLAAVGLHPVSFAGGDRVGGDGASAAGSVEVGDGAVSVAVFRRTGDIDGRFPRRVNVASRDPLFELRA